MTALQTLLKRAGDWLHPRAQEKNAAWIIVLLPTKEGAQPVIGSNLPADVRDAMLEKLAASLKKKDEAEPEEAA